MSAEKQKTILLVDDEAIIAMTERVILEKFGYKVIIANCGEEAIAVVEKTPAIDLVLMDINLGAGIDGTETAAIILQQRDLPVVFLSSHTEPEVVEKTEKITSYGYVVKNSSSTVLDASIKMAFKLFAAKIKEQEKEKALRESEASYRVLFSGASDGILLADAQTKQFRYANPAICRMLGYTEEEFQRISVADIHPEESLDHVLAEFAALAQGEIRSSPDLPCLRKDGTIFYADISHSAVVLEGRDYHASFFHDITERRRAEEAVFQSKKDWEDCFDSITDMITIHDNDYNIIRTNKAGKALLKLPALEEHLKLKCFSFYHGTDAPPAGCPSCDCLKSGMPGVFELFEPHLNRYLEIRALPRLDSNNQCVGLIHIVRDITERKLVSDTIKESELRLKAQYQGMPIPTFIWRKKGEDFELIDFNDAAKTISLDKTSEFIGRKASDLYADRQDILRDLQQCLVERKVIKRETKSEHFIPGKYIILTIVPIPADLVMVHMEDISERKQTEKALQESEEKFRILIENSHDIIYTLSLDGIFTFVSPSWTTLLGHSLDQVVGKPIQQFIHADDLASCMILLQKVIKTGQRQDGVDAYRVRHADGSWRWHVTNAVPIRNAAGTIIGGEGIARDITERKRADEAVNNSLRFQQALLDAVPYPIFYKDANFVYLGGNKAFEKYIGLPQEQFVGKTANDISPADLAATYEKADRDLLGKRGVQTYEDSVAHADGTRHDVIFNKAVFTNSEGKATGLIGVILDISERKRAEKLPEALYKISQAVYAADNLNELFKHVHRALADIIPTDNLFIALLSDDGKTMNFPYFIDEKNPNDTASIQADNLQSLSVEVLATKRSLLLDEAELLERYASGRNKVWGSAPKCWLGVPLMIRDTIIGVMAVQDYHKAGAYVDKDVKLLESTAGQIAIAIDRKRAAEALRESVESFKGYFNMGTIGMCVSSLETGWIEVNDCLCRMLGYSREELLHLTWAEMTYPDDLNADLELFNQVLAGERDSYELEKRFIRKDGQVIHTQLYATCQRNPDGTVHHLLASLVDTSERKRAEDAIQNTLRFQQALMDAVPSPIFYKDAKCIYIGGNKAFEQFIGLAQEQFIGKTVYDISPTDLAEKYDRADRELLKNKGIQTYEASVVYADGTRHAVIFNKALFTDAEGKVAGLIGVLLDISERKRAEILEQAVYDIARAADEAKSMDDLYRSVHLIIKGLMPAENILIARYDEKANLVSFPYFVDEKDPIPKPRKSSRGLTDYVLRTGRTLLSDAALEKELERSGEAKRRGSPSACWLGVPLKFGDKAIGVIALDNYSDPKAYGEREKKILEYVSSQIANAIVRKQAEEEIKRQLTEKEILLREVHHRIKNNIAAIGGLISLRLQSISNPEAVAVLQDAVGRVDSMRILYDKLLLSEDYKDISVKNYVESLIDTVVTLFPDNAKVKIDKRIGDFYLDSKRLFPLGIIVNELLTNKMKYAFSGRKRGSIRIDLALADNRARLTIQDDGNSLPPGFDAREAKGFGLMLVKMLSKQLGGSFAIEDHAGVRCTVEFDI